MTKTIFRGKTGIWATVDFDVTPKVGELLSFNRPSKAVAQELITFVVKAIIEDKDTRFVDVDPVGSVTVITTFSLSDWE